MMVDSAIRKTEKTTAKEGIAFRELRAAMEERTDQTKSSCLMAMEAAQHYNAKLFEFAKANNDAAIEYAQQLVDVRFPAEFIRITTRQDRKSVV